MSRTLQHVLLLRSFGLIFLLHHILDKEVLNKFLDNAPGRVYFLKHVRVAALNSAHQSETHAALLLDFSDNAA